MLAVRPCTTLQVRLCFSPLAGIAALHTASTCCCLYPQANQWCGPTASSTQFAGLCSCHCKHTHIAVTINVVPVWLQIRSHHVLCHYVPPHFIPPHLTPPQPTRHEPDRPHRTLHHLVCLHHPVPFNLHLHHPPYLFFFFYHHHLFLLLLHTLFFFFIIPLSFSLVFIVIFLPVI